MKKIITIIGIIIIGLLVVVGVVLSGRNFIAKNAIEYTAEKKLGLDVNMEKFYINLLESSVDISNLTIDNPKGFSKNKMIFIPKIYVDYVLSDMLKNKIHIKKMDFHLQEVLVEKNKKGLNLNSIKLPESKKKKPTPSKFKKTPSKKEKKLLIDKLHIKIDKVKYIRLTEGGKVEQVANFNLDATFKNISSFQELKAVIVSQLGPQAILNKVEGINLQDIQKSLNKGKENLQENLKEFEESAEDMLNDLSF